MSDHPSASIVWLMIFGVDANSPGASAMNFSKCELVTCALPASPSRNPSTRTYSDGSSKLRDQSNHMLPGSLRVSLVKSATLSGKLSTYSGFGLNLTTMKITADHPFQIRESE